MASLTSPNKYLRKNNVIWNKEDREEKDKAVPNSFVRLMLPGYQSPARDFYLQKDGVDILFSILLSK